MGLSIGIVGLPNVGKSTLFNALAHAQSAAAANYPFCTIEPNKAMVPVPDPRLAQLAAIAKPEQVIHATIEFTDIAGLVKGASHGEGLGNKFLANVRECDALLHVTRCFEDADVVHVEGSVDPLRDISIIESELVLADLESLEKRVERLSKLARAEKAVRPELEAVVALQKHVEEGRPVRSFQGHDDEAVQPTLHDLRLLTDKPTIFVANVGEADVAADNDAAKAVRDYATRSGAACVRICAKIEEDIAGLPEAESAEYLASYGIDESGLDRIVRTAYDTLGLASFLTAGSKEVRAWTFHRGWKAPKAAGVVHSDFERGFIRAQVISCDDYVRYGGEQPCKARGLARLEGKDYEIADGDVVEFLFNV
ncbi:MAG: redox-regulated ATPase YchF [Kiritimatiellia bacterium]|jgi:GTP-binding protein YchF